MSRRLNPFLLDSQMLNMGSRTAAIVTDFFFVDENGVWMRTLKLSGLLGRPSSIIHIVSVGVPLRGCVASKEVGTMARVVWIEGLSNRWMIIPS
jgi:hypothetical protein